MRLRTWRRERLRRLVKTAAAAGISKPPPPPARSRGKRGGRKRNKAYLRKALHDAEILGDTLCEDRTRKLKEYDSDCEDSCLKLYP